MNKFPSISVDSVPLSYGEKIKGKKLVSRKEKSEKINFKLESKLNGIIPNE